MSQHVTDTDLQATAWVVIDYRGNELARVQTKADGERWLRVAYGDSYGGESVIPAEEHDS
jgi:hypothetical protein